MLRANSRTLVVVAVAVVCTMERQGRQMSADWQTPVLPRRGENRKRRTTRHTRWVIFTHTHHQLQSVSSGLFCLALPTAVRTSPVSSERASGGSQWPSALHPDGNTHHTADEDDQQGQKENEKMGARHSGPRLERPRCR